MRDELVKLEIDGAVARVMLNDPARRNALSLAMFDALDRALHTLADDANPHVTLLSGAGKAFCAGFDLEAVVNEPPLMATFIERLSALNRRLRRLPQVVVAAVQGAAIAGGCAMVSACDLVVVSRTAKLGYPVHRIGVSPAVTIPTLQQAIGAGATRSLLMSGELISGEEAVKRGLASHLSESDNLVPRDAESLCETLGGHGPRALRATKVWLNELDGSLDDRAFQAVAVGSGSLATGEEAAHMLRAFWSNR